MSNICIGTRNLNEGNRFDGQIVPSLCNSNGSISSQGVMQKSPTNIQRKDVTKSILHTNYYSSGNILFVILETVKKNWIH